MIWIAVVAVLALVLGLASSIVVRRRAANPEQAVRNWRVFNGCCMLLAAVVLFFIGITEEHRRYLNIGIAVALAVIAIWQLRNMKRRTPHRP